MVLKILDSFNTIKEIQNPTYIPRQGELVCMGYTPAQRVSDVIYDFEKELILISLN